MSSSWMCAPLRSAAAVLKPAESERPHRIRRRIALTCVFVGVLATGAATNSWSGESASGRGTSPVRGQSPASRPMLGGDALAGRGGVTSPSDADALVSRSGDRWSAAYSADEYQGHQQALKGEYIGVGISVRRVHGRTEVVEVQPDSPAERAGIREGDRLRGIDGLAVRGHPVTEVVAWLRGPEHEAVGSRVVVELERDGRRWRAELTRAALAAETVTVSRLPDQATRIKISSFTEGSGDLVRQAVRRLPAGSGVLLDLRGNSGGLVVEAVTVASAFLDGGLVATYDVHDTECALYASPGGDTEVPLVVLVDSGTMSAAELLTGALQDRGRAIVVGSRTFGKGTVQIPREQPDGSVAELTVGEYATPTGRTVEGEGLAPDLRVAPGTRAESRARTVLGGLDSRS